jgi:glycosyltransferase involved in cell wall biosynthesis
MVTTGRFDKIRRSVRCYLKQIYPNKELIIVSQGTNDVNRNIRDYVTLLGNNIYFHTAPPRLSLGGMRNLSLELTHGEIICQWDDDDLSHPLRLARQFGALVSDGIVASAYQEHFKWFEDTGEMYWVDWSIETGEDRRYLHGTSMFRKQLFHTCGNLLYPDTGTQSNKEEDWNAVKKILQIGGIAPVRDGYQYIYTYHGNNVYWRAHHELVLRKRVYTTEELLERKPIIESALRECGVDKKIKMCSINGVAFEYEPY